MKKKIWFAFLTLFMYIKPTFEAQILANLVSG